MSKFKGQTPVTVAGMTITAPNTIARHGEWHLSHNSSTAGYGCETTALVLRERVFFVLCGDHRDAWGDAADDRGLTGALNYFMAHSESAHRMSEHMMALGLKADPFGTASTLEDMVTPDRLAILRDHFGE